MNLKEDIDLVVNVQTSQSATVATQTSSQLGSMRQLTFRQKELLRYFDELLLPLRKKIQGLHERNLEVQRGVNGLLEKIKASYYQRLAHIASLRQQATQTQPIIGCDNTAIVEEIPYIFATSMPANAQRLPRERRREQRSRSGSGSRSRSREKPPKEDRSCNKPKDRHRSRS